jgi:isopentenyl-diphosphate delta-isomerase, type 1
MDDKVILVDEANQVVGVAEKMRAHRDGSLHRAFSIFVFNSTRELLIQKRSAAKYHSANLWSNTCCGHPRPNESIDKAAHRRLNEELGFDCPLKLAFTFTYKASLGSNLFEHEYDHVFIGLSDQQPSPNPSEVDEWMWVNPQALTTDVKEHSDNFTCWLKLCLERALDAYGNLAGGS